MQSFVTRLARFMALLGGLVLTALVILTCLSVAGRGLNTLGHSDLMEGAAPGFAAWLIGTGVGPVTGDYELVTAGMAFAIFAFLPLTQLTASHATVDVFTGLMPARANAWLIAVWEVVLAVVILVIGWRLHAGFLEKLDNGETSFLLQYPVWWSYGASFAAAAVAALVSVWCAAARVTETLTGSPILPRGGEAGH
jgi:TRAP-type C4-dicarboxylate transport system permease small subunit